ncbi:MAG TPA: ATP-binding protein [Gammaproteobacteria bacterium]|jgi:signal transduction histidine kinase
MRSLKARLAAGLSAALLVAFGLQWLLVSLATRGVTEDYMESRLARDIDVLLAGLVFDSNGAPQLTRMPVDRFEEGPYSGYYYQVRIGAVTLRSTSLWDQVLETPEVPPGATLRSHVTGPLDQPLLLISRGFLKQDRRVQITIAEDIGELNAGIRSFQWQYFAVTAAFLVLLVVMQQWIVRRSLRPLISARIDLERVGRGEAETLSEEVPVEIGPLVRGINALLVLLSRRLSRSRTIVGNMAHALKAPLSLIMQLTRDPSLHPELRDKLNDQVSSIRSHLERELNRARLAGEGAGGRRFRPQDDLPPLVNTLLQIHAERSVDIEVADLPGGVWNADREDVLELLGNLGDNACKWSRGRVRISLDDAGGITVEDDGAGGTGRETSAARGTRLDERVPGHGLGLSIVRDIVEHYGGEIVFDRSPDLGGMRVEVKLWRRAAP